METIKEYYVEWNKEPKRDHPGHKIKQSTYRFSSTEQYVQGFVEGLKTRPRTKSVYYNEV